MTAVIILACVLAYLGAGITTARIAFSRVRPSRVPTCGRGHDQHIRFNKDEFSCYRQSGADGIFYKIETDRQAFSRAVWAVPFWWALLVWVAVTAKPRELPGERAERLRQLERENGRLEAENERLRRQQEGRSS